MPPRVFRAVLLALVLAATFSATARAQDELDGGVSYAAGQEFLESVFFPPIKHAPFSLILTAEWARPIRNGGNFTMVNARPIMRDSQGRIYMERRLLQPKGTNRPSPLSMIQLADTVARTFYQCDPKPKICELFSITGADPAPAHPELTTSAKSKDGKVYRLHEDLGKQFFAGVPVHFYRDTFTYQPGALGNDLPATSVREFRFSEDLGFNVTSIVDNPQVGRQTFTATELTTTEPDPRFFLPPEGYTIVDKRKPSAKP